MIKPEIFNADEALEYAAQLIEESSLLDFCGVASRRKRDREDAALRLKTIKETRKNCADHIRAFKSRPDLDAKAVLARLAELTDDIHHTANLTDAWPLAWKGWVDIECRIKCNSNWIPPQIEYRITLTEEGQRILEQRAGGKP